MEERSCIPDCCIKKRQNFRLQIFEVLQNHNNTTAIEVLERKSAQLNNNNQVVHLRATTMDSNLGQLFFCEIMNNGSCVVQWTNVTYCSRYSLECTLKLQNDPEVCNEVHTDVPTFSSVT